MDTNPERPIEEPIFRTQRRHGHNTTFGQFPLVHALLSASAAHTAIRSVAELSASASLPSCPLATNIMIPGYSVLTKALTPWRVHVSPIVAFFLLDFRWCVTKMRNELVSLPVAAECNTAVGVSIASAIAGAGGCSPARCLSCVLFVRLNRRLTLEMVSMHEASASAAAAQSHSFFFFFFLRLELVITPHWRGRASHGGRAPLSRSRLDSADCGVEQDADRV